MAGISVPNPVEIKRKIAFRRPVWHTHPEVGNHKTASEHIADHLKYWFGTWVFFWVVVSFFVFWLKFAHDPGFVVFGTVMWVVVVIQDIILQISSNRSDRVDSELALYTHQNTSTLMEISTEILDINRKQNVILSKLNELMDENTILTRQIDRQAALLTQIREQIERDAQPPD
jgi:uncharacterized membrane protein